MPSRRRGSFLRQKEESRQQPAKFGSWAFVRMRLEMVGSRRWGWPGRRGGVREPSELVPAAGRARARVTERRSRRVIAVGLTPSSRARASFIRMCPQRHGGARRRAAAPRPRCVSLALLVVRGCDVDDAADRAVRPVVRRRHRRFAGLHRRRAVDFSAELAGRAAGARRRSLRRASSRHRRASASR